MSARTSSDMNRTIAWSAQGLLRGEAVVQGRVQNEALRSYNYSISPGMSIWCALFILNTRVNQITTSVGRRAMKVLSIS
jgi:hypothetical protein